MNQKVVSQEEFFHWSLNQLARAFGMARETVQKKLTEGNVKPSGTRRTHYVYPIKEAAIALVAPVMSGDVLGNPDLMAPSDRRHWFASENDRVKLLKEQGQLVDIEDCRQRMVEIIEIGLPVFDSLADELELQFELGPEVITQVEQKIDVVRHKWADSLEELI